MVNRLFASALILLVLTVGGEAAAKHDSPSGPPLDGAFVQKVWDGWSTLDAAGQAKFYAQGPHVFFDIAPLKYDSWTEFEQGVTKELGDYKTAKFTVNDDLQLHPAGEFVWGTATIKEDATMKTGKRELATFRWTVIFGKQNGKWVIMHEHVSQPVQ